MLTAGHLWTAASRAHGWVRVEIFDRGNVNRGPAGEREQAPLHEFPVRAVAQQVRAKSAPSRWRLDRSGNENRQDDERLLPFATW